MLLSTAFTVIYLSLLGITALADPSVITIGGLLSSNAFQLIFQDAVEKLNTDPETRLQGILFKSTSVIMVKNPVQSALLVCNEVLSKKVYAVVVSHPHHEPSRPPISISFTCGYYKIPVIGITARDSVLSDNNLHASYLRTVPAYADQGVGWADIVRYFQWKNIIFMHCANQEGRAIFARFQNEIENRHGRYSNKNTAAMEKEQIKISQLLSYQHGQESYVDELSFIDDSRVILLSANEEDAYAIFRDAAKLNMTEGAYVWIVSERALYTNNTPLGTIGMSLKNSDKEEYHIRDSVKVIGKAFYKALRTQTITEPPSACNRSSSVWESGEDIYELLIKEELENGFTGKVMFNDVGDRLMSVYEIINVQEDGRRVVVGTYGNHSDSINLLHIPSKSAIVWPDGSSTVPKGIEITTHLHVVTIESVPFVFIEPMDPKEGCPEDTVYCPRPNSSDPEHDIPFCCSGYCIDMLNNLRLEVNFTYDLHLVEDGQFGALVKHNNSNKKVWNGMMGEVIDGRADLIVAPMTITPERAADIDFTKPFKYQGLTILVRKEEKNSSLASFLQPFQDTLWILVGLSVHVVALVLYLLDRFSPFGRFKLARSSDTEEDALNLSSAMWFAWGVLLNSGIGEGTPRSFSARVLGMVWAGFAMIIVASYTANLAAFLVLDRPEASISGIDDARLRNPQDDFKYATIRNSAVELYFKRQVELSTMYRTMETFNYTKAVDAIEAVSNKQLQAFIWDSSRLEYEAAKNCDLVTAGEMFGRSGYGIGMRKDSPWLNKLSLSILSLHETGRMEELDSTWILRNKPECSENDQSPATLGLTNMAGVFMLVAGGILTGVFLIFVEILYKRHRGLKEKELEIARNAADRWRGNIEKRKTLRRTLLENSPNYQPNGRTDRTSASQMSGDRQEILGKQTSVGSGPSTYNRTSPTVRHNPAYDPDHINETV